MLLLRQCTGIVRLPSEGMLPGAIQVSPEDPAYDGVDFSGLYVYTGGAPTVLQRARQGGGQQRQQGYEGQGRGAHSSLNVSMDSKSTVLKCR